MLKIQNILLFMLVLLSCGKDDNGDAALIEQYLIENGISYVTTSSVYVHIKNQGSDIYPSDGSIVELAYTAAYLDGQIFDKTLENTYIKINLKNAISGLAAGLKVLSKGSNGTIYIPSSQGYGSNPPFGVRKNAILVYQVYIHDINH